MTKFFLAWLTIITLTFPSIMFGALPPTRSGGQSDTLSTTFDFQAPLSQITKTSGTSGLIETGNYDLLKNPGFEGQTLVGWSVSGLSGLSTLNPGLGKQALSFYTTGAAQTFTSDSVTIPPAYYGQNGELTCAVKHAGSAVGGNIGLNASAGTIDQKIELSQASGTYQYFKINFVFPTSGTLNVLGTSGSPYGESFVDDCYLGLARNVAQCGLDTPWVSFTPIWTTNAGTLPTVSTDQGWWRRVGDSMEIRIFRVYTGAGTGGGVQILTVPEGRTIDLSGSKMSTAVGGTGAQGQLGGGSWYDDTLSGTQAGISVTGYPHSSTQIGVIPNGSASTGVNTLFGNKDRLAAVFKVPIVGWTASQCVMPERQRAPKITRYTSGSGTHTWSSGVTYATVRMVGGGGGGASSGTSGWAAGTSGGNTTFSGYTAIGGANAPASTATTNSGGAGGGVTAGTGATVISAIQGGNGGGSGTTTGANIRYAGGIGGVSRFGGSSTSPAGQAGTAASANSGGGGGGAGHDAGSGNGSGGGGGGAGGYYELQFDNPTGTTSYSVGSGGSGATAGTNGSAGGAGGSGVIEVTEYFGYTTAILANSVSTGVTNGTRIEAASIDNTGTATIVRQTGSWITSVSRTGAGVVEINYAANTWSVAPMCTLTTNSATLIARVESITTTRLTTRLITSAGVSTDNPFYVMCIGLR